MTEIKDKFDPERIYGQIKHVLSIYPYVSGSMLQISLALPADKWRPVFAEMLISGEVQMHTVSHTAPSGRVNTYNIYQLTTTKQYTEVVN